jgi:hypothetical protein
MPHILSVMCNSEIVIFMLFIVNAQYDLADSHFAECWNVECCYVSVILLSVISLTAISLSVEKLSVILLSAIMMPVDVDYHYDECWYAECLYTQFHCAEYFMQSVLILGVVAPLQYLRLNF